MVQVGLSLDFELHSHSDNSKYYHRPKPSGLCKNPSRKSSQRTLPLASIYEDFEVLPILHEPDNSHEPPSPGYDLDVEHRAEPPPPKTVRCQNCERSQVRLVHGQTRRMHALLTLTTDNVYLQTSVGKFKHAAGQLPRRFLIT